MADLVHIHGSRDLWTPCRAKVDGGTRRTYHAEQVTCEPCRLTPEYEAALDRLTERMANPGPSLLDRIEAAHWARFGVEQLRSWLGEYADAGAYPSGHGTVEVWDDALKKASEYVNQARLAIRGRHSRAATSILADLEALGVREPDVRPVLERRPVRDGG